MPIILIRAVKEAPALAGRLQAYRTAELAAVFLPSEIIGSGERILAWRLGQVRLGAASSAGSGTTSGILAFADRFRCHSGCLLFCRWESPAPGAHASNPGAGCLPGTGEYGQAQVGVGEVQVGGVIEARPAGCASHSLHSPAGSRQRMALLSAPARTSRRSLSRPPCSPDGQAVTSSRAEKSGTASTADGSKVALRGALRTAMEPVRLRSEHDQRFACRG